MMTFFPLTFFFLIAEWDLTYKAVHSSPKEALGY